MEIRDLKILNFQGLKGQHEYKLDGKCFALCQKNGTGKTSFMNAVRYGITGRKPTGKMIHELESTTAVGFTLKNGVTYIRQDFNNKPAKYYMNSKAVKKQDLDNSIQAVSGVAQGTMNIATSSEVLAGLSSQEFGNLLLSYIPRTLTKEKILAYIPEVGESAKLLIDLNLPDLEFGTSELDDFYNMCFENRKKLRKKIADLKPVVNKFSEVVNPGKSSNEYKAEYNEIQKSQSENITKAKKKAEYDKLFALKKQQESQIMSYKKMLDEIDIPVIENGIRQKKIDAELVAEQKLNELKQVYYSTCENNKALEKALETIMQPVCPLSEKLKCTVDKSPVTGELESSIKKNKDTISMTKKLVEDQKTVIASIKNEIKKIDADYQTISRVNELKETIKKLEDTLPQLPEDPGTVDDISEIAGRLNDVLRKYNQALEFEKSETLKKEYDETKKDCDDYEFLVSTFAPKGVIKNNITKYYISVFADKCNEKASLLKDGLQIKFEVKNGVTMLMDTDGSGIFKEYAALSGGEKAYMLFLVLDMLNALTGFKVIMMDELSILDKESFRQFVELIVNHKDDYDLVLLACAEHDDLTDIINTYGITKIEV